jgi:two-component system, OmpR family, alkaline phosphatase synthesis response regulator PhoP
MSEENKNKKIKIMLIDDDRFLLDMYVIKFKAKNFDIETFSESQQALNKLRDGENPDIIILDIIMPNMDGMELLKIIREEKLAQSSAIVMLTNQPDEVEKATALGVDGYIIKAVNIPSEVVEQVTNIYNKKKNK